MKRTLSLLLVAAMIVCMIPAFSVAISADPVVTAGKKAHGADMTVTDTTLTSTGNDSIYVFDQTFTAGTFEATLTKTQAGDDGIIFGLEGDSYDFWEGGDRYYFLFAASGGDLILAKTGNGLGWCWMKSCEIPGWDHVSAVKLKVEYNGNGHIKIYANDNLAYDYCDGTPLTGNRFGVRAQKAGVTYSDIKVTSAEPTNEGIAGGIVFDTARTTLGTVATGYKSGGPWKNDGTAIAMNEDKTALVSGSWATAFIIDNDVLPLKDGSISARVKANIATDMNLVGIVFGLEADRNITVWKRSLYTNPYYILYVNQNGKVIIAKGGVIPNQHDGLQELSAGSTIEGYSVPETKVDLRVEFKETDGKLNIKGYVGETLMVEYTDETPLTGTRYGVMGRCAGTTYYNLTAVNNDAICIRTPEDFVAIQNKLDGNYILLNDITLTGTQAISYKNEGALFKGTFDGNGHTVNLDLADNAGARFAMFCSAEGCTIKNLNVEGKVTSTGNSTAALIGTAKNSATITIDNVTVNVDVEADGHNGTGGFIGCVENNGTVIIKNSTNKGHIEREVAGGFIGRMDGNGQTITFENCVNEGSILCTNRYSDRRGAGGFIGACGDDNRDTSITFTNCTNKGEVRADMVSAGALIGSCHPNKPLTATGCSNTGSVISGGWTVPESSMAAKNIAVWGGAGNVRLTIQDGEVWLFGNPNVDVMPDEATRNAAKFYVNGKDVTERSTVTDGGERRFQFLAGPIDYTGDFTSVTIVLPDGQFGTWGIPTPGREWKYFAGNAEGIDGDILNDKIDKSTVADNGKIGFWGSENLEKMFDDNLFDTKAGGGANFSEGPYVITFSTTEPVIVGSYAFVTGTDTADWRDRNAKTWKFYGSNDGENWTLIDEVADSGMLNVNNTAFVFGVDTAAEYSNYKMEIYATYNGQFQHDSLILIAAEFEITSKDSVKITEGSSKGATFTANLPITGVRLSGDVEFTPNDYSINGNSVTINAEFLKTLAVGTYTFIVTGASGDQEVTVVVSAPAPVNTQTGDLAAITIAAVALMSLAGVAVVASKRKKIED